VVYAREVAGQELTFGVSGKLIMNALVMYDHQTETLWSQFIAEGVKGPLTGTRLEILPVQLTTWGEWTRQHPETLALDKGIRRSSGDPYRGYYQSGGTGVIGESNKDRRLTSKELVLGVVNERTQKAFPFRYLQETPVLNDTFDGRPVVATLDTSSVATGLFDRTVDGQVLTFTQMEDTLLMRDLETGTVWNKFSGQAEEGQFQGRRLERLPAFAAFWFSWSDFHPDTELYEG
jgi:hypothetical protein